ncbi:SDR family oxidoreductase [Microvirga alba]|uniref:SDR family oxidoreductase n=1 Tax=Microvirga alba TaxID=2791025 RepID=A0A931BQL3_9HYPH|nr:SDR family oxidoreductase [Microvirga alba]MBF9233859.1 SDR family oxidoreductase [Microvirga alba]
MDLQMRGRRAIVCASSRGLGLACAEALLGEGVNVVINGRNDAVLQESADRLALSYPGKVNAVAGDITTPEGRAALLAACPDADILVNNNAGPDPAPFEKISDATWLAGIEANMLAPLFLVRALLPGMIERRYGRIVSITSAMVTTPRPRMTLSAGARAGLTAALKGLSLDVARYNVTINNILPERFDTDRQEFMAQQAMKRTGCTYEEARRQQTESIAAKRLGRPEELGALCAFLCSPLSGYMSGQNLHLDGGSYPALV